MGQYEMGLTNLDFCPKRVNWRLLERSSLRNCRRLQFMLTVWDNSDRQAKKSVIGPYRNGNNQL
jgi:hypothetical protein